MKEELSKLIAKLGGIGSPDERLVAAALKRLLDNEAYIKSLKEDLDSAVARLQIIRNVLIEQEK